MRAPIVTAFLLCIALTSILCQNVPEKPAKRKNVLSPASNSVLLSHTETSGSMRRHKTSMPPVTKKTQINRLGRRKSKSVRGLRLHKKVFGKRKKNATRKSYSYKSNVSSKTKRSLHTSPRADIRHFGYDLPLRPTTALFAYNSVTESCEPVQNWPHTKLSYIGRQHNSMTECENNVPHASYLICYDGKNRKCDTSTGKHTGQRCFRSFPDCHDHLDSMTAKFFYDKERRQCIMATGRDWTEKKDELESSLHDCVTRHSVRFASQVVLNVRTGQCLTVDVVRATWTHIFDNVRQCELYISDMFCYNLEDKRCTVLSPLLDKKSFRNFVCFKDSVTCEKYAEALKIRYLFDDKQSRCVKTNDISKHKPLRGKHYFTHAAQCNRFKESRIESNVVQCWQFVPDRRTCEWKPVKKAAVCDPAKHSYSDRTECVRNIMFVTVNRKCFALDVVRNTCRETSANYESCDKTFNRYSTLAECNSQRVVTTNRKCFALDVVQNTCRETRATYAKCDKSHNMYSTLAECNSQRAVTVNRNCFELDVVQNACRETLATYAKCDKSHNMYSTLAECNSQRAASNQKCFLLDTVLNTCHETSATYTKCDKILNMYSTVDECNRLLRGTRQWYKVDQNEEHCEESDFDHENVLIFPDVGTCEQYIHKIHNPQLVDFDKPMFVPSNDGQHCTTVSGKTYVAFKDLIFNSMAACTKHADQMKDLDQRRTRYRIKDFKCQKTVRKDETDIFNTHSDCVRTYLNRPYTIWRKFTSCTASEYVPVNERGKMFQDEDACQQYIDTMPPATFFD